jgi:hypothetical protein
VEKLKTEVFTNPKVMQMFCKNVQAEYKKEKPQNCCSHMNKLQEEHWQCDDLLDEAIKSKFTGYALCGADEGEFWSPSADKWGKRFKFVSFLFTLFFPKQLILFPLLTNIVNKQISILGSLFHKLVKCLLGLWGPTFNFIAATKLNSLIMFCCTHNLTCSA